MPSITVGSKVIKMVTPNANVTRQLRKLGFKYWQKVEIAKSVISSVQGANYVGFGVADTGLNIGSPITIEFAGMQLNLMMWARKDTLQIQALIVNGPIAKIAAAGPYAQSGILEFSKKFKEVQFLDSADTTRFSVALSVKEPIRNYSVHSANISLAQFNQWFSQPALIAKIKLIPR